jgi:hypothetical protein
MTSSDGVDLGDQEIYNGTVEDLDLQLEDSQVISTMDAMRYLSGEMNAYLTMFLMR